MQLQQSIRRKRVLTVYGLSPAHSKMKVENTITRFKNLTLLNSEGFDSESKTSNVIKFQWVKVSSTIKNSRKLRKWEVWRISVQKELKTRFSAEFVGVPKKITTIHWSSLVNARARSVSFTSSALRTGCWLKNKKNHQMPKTKTYALFTGNVSNVKFVSKCTLTHSK